MAYDVTAEGATLQAAEDVLQRRSRRRWLTHQRAVRGRSC
jgi:hypothetical protein